jgi:hypothetical protein
VQELRSATSGTTTSCGSYDHVTLESQVLSAI